MEIAHFRERLDAAWWLGVLVVWSSNLALAGAANPLTSEPARSVSAAGTWDPKAAAAYLDQRATWWITWKNAERDHGTFCVSCHTAVPYELARPALHKTLADPSPTESERIILDNVTKRVRMWKEVAPPYNDKDYGPNKEVESRATEAVLLAFVLANHDAQTAKLSN